VSYTPGAGSGEAFCQTNYAAQKKEKRRDAGNLAQGKERGSGAQGDPSTLCLEAWQGEGENTQSTPMLKRRSIFFFKELGLGKKGIQRCMG